MWDMSDRPKDSNLTPALTTSKGVSAGEASTGGTEWHTLSGVPDLACGEVVEVFVEGNILVISNVEGELYAMDGLCAHQGGPLGKGKLKGCLLTCPWHGWQYDVATGRQILSQTITQRTYPIRRQNDTIQVCLESEESA